jgi:archaellum component FlaG (FlaF/FlaG flagellin family)
MFRRFTRKRAVVALGVVAALAITGAAIAYFTSSGSGSGQASVGTASAFSVTVSAPTGGPLLPGSGAENLAYTVKNTGSGTQNLSTSSAKVAQDTNGDITASGASVAGCKASWFTPLNNAPTYGPLAGSASAHGSVDVTMPDNSTDNQDPCQSAQPDITVTVG